MPKTSSGQHPFSPQSDGRAWVPLFVTCPTRGFAQAAIALSCGIESQAGPCSAGGLLEILVPSPSALSWALARSLSNLKKKKKKSISLWNDLL